MLNLIAALKREGLTLVGRKGIDPKAAVKAALIETFKHHSVKLKAKT
nr:hypothetical protein [uncultured Dongia sp.]